MTSVEHPLRDCPFDPHPVLESLVHAACYAAEAGNSPIAAAACTESGEVVAVRPPTRGEDFHRL
jgi:hypothetical protein